MGKINIANLKRTLYYLKRNGLKNTWYAARERLSDGQAAPYVYVAPSEEELEKQRASVAEGQRAGVYDGIKFSIVVPTYRTGEKQLDEMIASVIDQSFENWELIIVDATEDSSVKRYIDLLLDVRKMARHELGEDEVPGEIKYVRLPRNGGISENTNQALQEVSGDYVGLLDHDDLLTPDALYEMAECVRKAREDGIDLQLLYSDEDKCNTDTTEFYEPHFKEKFNLDLILSNNYICHFTVMKAELIQKLRLRKEYDGAQDYDLILRAVSELEILRHPEKENLVRHIPKVLYHWRCHAASTAGNPRSKSYAYEAGRRALQDFADRNGLGAEAEHLKHLGFYRLAYQGGPGEQAADETGRAPEWVLDMLRARPDIGIVGGCLVRKGSVAGGRMDGEGKVLYQGLSVHASGYMHRAALAQDAEAVDIRCLIVREELRELFGEAAGQNLPSDTDFTALSLKLCKAVRERGYRIVYLPEWQEEENE